MNTDVRWCVEERDTGMPCASGSAPNQEAASREMMRYALQYGQDGPVRYWMRQNRKTLVKGEIAGQVERNVSRLVPERKNSDAR